MTAVEAVQKDEVFKVESEYTSAALKTSVALQEWWKQSEANHMKLSSFAHILIVRFEGMLSMQAQKSAAQVRENMGCLP